jgi:carboxyl-terminal processing protease
VGQRTFGKGLVQTTRPLSYNGQLKVTTAKYYIPSGRCIQAVDYTHRNPDGSVGIIPDSLIREYKTNNGRKVYDGGGIAPDIALEPEMLSNIAISLFTKNLIFDYATLFTLEHPSVTGVDQLKLTDAEYQRFLDFLSNKSYDYTTQSDDKLEELIKVARQEKYFDVANAEFTALKSKLAHDKEKDLRTFQKEISMLIFEEVSSRYFYQKGRIQASLSEDPELSRAVAVLKNPAEYASLLNVPGTGIVKN